MTIALYKSVQTWFTTRMPATKTTRESIYDKAERILSDPSRVRTRTSANGAYWTGDVDGDTGTYQVVAVSPEIRSEWELPGTVACTCRAGRKPMRCSHMLVAEEMRLRNEPPVTYDENGVHDLR
jgi:hypothetical protein